MKSVIKCKHIGGLFEYVLMIYKNALISGFCRDVDEICALLGYYAALCGTCLKNNYHTTPCNTPEEHRSYKNASPYQFKHMTFRCEFIHHSLDFAPCDY
jgi:hypothetical protein